MQFELFCQPRFGITYGMSTAVEDVAFHSAVNYFGDFVANIIRMVVGKTDSSWRWKICFL